MPKSLLVTGFLVTLLLPPVVAAEIYKSVDEDGNVTFSDQPSPGAERIEKKEITTVPADTPTVDFSSEEGNSEQQTETEGYNTITIVSPQNDTAIRSNGGSLSVNVNLQPALHDGHSVVLYMDGQEVQRGTSSAFQFADVERGTHTLTAAVETAAGEEVGRSNSVSFTLLRHSIQHPPPANPAPNVSTPNQ